jgi:hypothetical protein
MFHHNHTLNTSAMAMAPSMNGTMQMSMSNGWNSMNNYSQGVGTISATGAVIKFFTANGTATIRSTGQAGESLCSGVIISLALEGAGKTRSCLATPPHHCSCSDAFLAFLATKLFIYHALLSFCCRCGAVF